MLTTTNGILWQTLEGPLAGLELARLGWGTTEALTAGLPHDDIAGLWLVNPVTGGLPPVAQRFHLPATHGTPVLYNGKNVGTHYEDDYAEYVLLMGITAEDLTAGRVAQSDATFEAIEGALKSIGFDFHNVVRTWFYLDGLLEWYDDFNRSRDRFFESRGIFGGFVPASTGIGCANLNGAAIIAGAIAMRPKQDAAGKPLAHAEMVESPLQCSALDYRSSFSRAAEIVTPEGQYLFISGTASIEPQGATVHLDDGAKQIGLTMDVVEAILGARQMTFKDITRAVAYIKRPEDRCHWQAWLAAHNLPADYAQEVIADVCRDDLLFELEADAVKLS